MRSAVERKYSASVEMTHRPLAGLKDKKAPTRQSCGCCAFLRDFTHCVCHVVQYFIYAACLRPSSLSLDRWKLCLYSSDELLRRMPVKSLKNSYCRYKG